MKQIIVCMSLLAVLLAPGLTLAAAPVSEPGVAPTVARIQARLTPAPVVRGHFEQAKTLAGFDQPLRSSGQFSFSRDHGVIWQIQTPFAATVVITRDALRERGGDGAWRRTAADRHPAVAMIHRLSQALMGADLDQLQQHFELQPLPTDGPGWQLQLQPRDGTMAQLLRAAEVQGAETVQALTLIETNGDRTDIRLHGTTDDQLQAAERDLLSAPDAP